MIGIQAGFTIKSQLWKGRLEPLYGYLGNKSDLCPMKIVINAFYKAINTEK